MDEVEKMEGQAPDDETTETVKQRVVSEEDIKLGEDGAISSNLQKMLEKYGTEQTDIKAIMEEEKSLVPPPPPPPPPPAAVIVPTICLY